MAMGIFLAGILGYTPILSWHHPKGQGFSMKAQPLGFSWIT